MRLIDADELKKALNANCENLCPDKNTNRCEHCCPHNEFEDLIDNAPPIETTIENLIITLSVEELKATTWFKVDTPSGEAVSFRREKTGHWINDSEDYGYVECPFCHELTNCNGNKEELHYCWNCGANMRGEENE
jgi:hypothetical protein